MGTYLKAIVLVIVLLFLVTFGIKNNQPLQLYYYFNIQTSPIPFYGIVYLSIIIGIVIGMLVGLSSRFILKEKMKAVEAEIKALKKVEASRKEHDELPTPSKPTAREEKG